MSAQDKRTEDRIISAIKTATNSGTKPYDTTAEVVRVEGDTAWVHIPGGVTETPVSMSIDCKAGDTVRVRVSGGRAWITGNDTAPPTNDTEAIAAQAAAIVADKQAKAAAEEARNAVQATEKTSAHFWHDSEGAHVTEQTKNDYNKNPQGNNVLITADSVDIKKGDTVLASFGVDSINFKTEDKDTFSITVKDESVDNSGSRPYVQFAATEGKGRMAFAALTDDENDAATGYIQTGAAPDMQIVDGHLDMDKLAKTADVSLSAMSRNEARTQSGILDLQLNTLSGGNFGFSVIGQTHDITTDTITQDVLFNWNSGEELFTGGGIATGKPLIKTVSKQVTANVAANASPFISITIPVPDGYTSVGLLGVGNGSGSCVLVTYGHTTDGSTATCRIRVRNMRSSAISSVGFSAIFLLVYNGITEGE